MDRINGADTVDIGSGRRGFRDENLVAGVAGTEVTADFLNSIQEEILKVVAAAGLVPSASDWTQLWQALQIHGLSTDNRSRRWLAVTSMTISSPPASPTSGDTYLIPTGASGIWSANVGNIAQWTGSTWTYLTPPNGHCVSLPDGRVFQRINSQYVELLASETRSGLVELATTDEAAAGTDATRAVTPVGLAVAITAAITKLINGSPAALDTLVELATALGNDANFATTMANALAGKVDLTRTATDARSGIVELATTAEATVGTDTTRAVTPAGLAAGLATTLGTVALAATGALDMANGLQLRWGGVAGSTTGTYHHAFTHGAFMAVANCYSGNTAGPDVVEVASATQTAVNVVTSRADTNTTYSTGTWWYLAIGY